MMVGTAHVADERVPTATQAVLVTVEYTQVLPHPQAGLQANDVLCKCCKESHCEPTNRTLIVL